METLRETTNAFRLAALFKLLGCSRASNVVAAQPNTFRRRNLRPAGMNHWPFSANTGCALAVRCQSTQTLPPLRRWRHYSTSTNGCTVLPTPASAHPFLWLLLVCSNSSGWALAGPWPDGWRSRDALECDVLGVPAWRQPTGYRSCAALVITTALRGGADLRRRFAAAGWRCAGRRHCLRSSMLVINVSAWRGRVSAEGAASLGRCGTHCAPARGFVRPGPSKLGLQRRRLGRGAGGGPSVVHRLRQATRRRHVARPGPPLPNAGVASPQGVAACKTHHCLASIGQPLALVLLPLLLTIKLSAALSAGVVRAAPVQC